MQIFLQGNADKVKEHESCSHVGHLQLLLEVIRGLQCNLSSQERDIPENLDFLQPGQTGSSLVSHEENELETDGGESGVNDKASSLHDDQAELAVGQQLDTLQQRVQVMENIISALNREVEKTQIDVVALERDNLNNQQIIQHLETKVRSLNKKYFMNFITKNIFVNIYFHYIQTLLLSYI